jgi:hypothetical protein
MVYFIRVIETKALKQAFFGTKRAQNSEAQKAGNERMLCLCFPLCFSRQRVFACKTFFILMVFQGAFSLIKMYSFSEKKGNKETMRAARTRKRAREGDDSLFPSPSSSLWEVVVKWDDICFKHILPRLNGTDVKLLYGVNTETRKLIKRSTREGVLRNWFTVSEMSSISTLEVAWEHYPWGTYDHFVQEEMDETWFCIRVACTNKLELLKWIREEKKCEWDSRTIQAAAYHGNLEVVKYCAANECPIDEWACANAAFNGHLEVLKYLREESKAPSDENTATWAARNGHLHILEYLVERKYDGYTEIECIAAAENGHLDCLKYLHETAKAPWGSWTVRQAHENNHADCVQYLLDNDCPLPIGWRYEDGELRVTESESESESESEE